MAPLRYLLLSSLTTSSSSCLTYWRNHFSYLSSTISILTNDYDEFRRAISSPSQTFPRCDRVCASRTPVRHQRRIYYNTYVRILSLSSLLYTHISFIIRTLFVHHPSRQPVRSIERKLFEHRAKQTRRISVPYGVK